MGSTSDVVEWGKGTGLTRFEKPMGPSLYERFISELTRRVVDALGEHEPFFYTFKRVLFWGGLPEDGDV